MKSSVARSKSERVRALWFEDEALVMIDQTRLPLELSYIHARDYRAVIDAIKRLAVRGAPAIGIAGAYAAYLAASEVMKSDSRHSFRVLTALDEIENARPTAVNLAWAVNRQRELVRAHFGDVDLSLLTYLRREADAILSEDEAMCRQIGEFGASLIGASAGVITHCNTGALATGGIGTALGAIYIAHEQGKKLRVYADETRPLLQGARLTAWELTQAGIDVTLIIDSAAGMLLAQKKIDVALVGADRIALNGDVINKIGTYTLATLCAAHDVPFYVCAPMSTYDPNMKSGADCVIEERSPLEITEGFGKRTAPLHTPVYSPAFDITPARLVSAYVTDQGIRPGGRSCREGSH